MTGVMGVQGRELSAEDIGQMEELLAEHPDWSRSRLSEELCRLWDLRNAKGRLKDMAGHQYGGREPAILVLYGMGRPVARALFGSAAWKCADRDAFIG